jgi:hypothetical protein
MRPLLSVIFAILCTAPAVALEDNWRFWQVTETNGPVCYAGVKVGQMVAGIAAQPGKPINGFIQGVVLPNTTMMQWGVEGFASRQHMGSQDSAFGGYIVVGIQQDFLTELSRGHILQLDTVNGRPDSATVPLVGSAQAVSEFRRCHSVGSNAQPGIVSLQPSQQHQPATQTAARPLSPEQMMDRLTTYTSVLGRGMGCGIDTQRAQQRVYAWLTATFPASEQNMAKQLYLLGIGVALKQQQAGATPDSCQTLAASFSSFPWPNG